MANKGEILVFTRKATTAGNDRKLQKLVDDYKNKGITIQHLSTMSTTGKTIAAEAYYQRKPNVHKAPGQRERLEQLQDFFAEEDRESLQISTSENLAHITIFENEGENKHADKDIDAMMEEKGLLEEWAPWP
ncbi:uncharacterized protein FTOL_07326 [Fusarium torulosum]|uniref:Uncharacterized protein n=1 Tax=Fusarium torulosum TaxID=33205 RepID=A0AAE8MBR1_9HYPO|nr:uncharacterized protein FTOL_07326 [Fusarium torulosum]